MEGAISNQPPQETRFLEVIFPEQSNHYGGSFEMVALDATGRPTDAGAAETAPSREETAS